ncbi:MULTISPECIES: GMC oxidoreductase [Microbacterium]|uniref:Cholesterol oxidase n=1 Tax=Microbacterium saccharophilum TaxID=1213358 RepID=A0A7Z7D0J5_9MICO|nr:MULTISPECIES: GMC family oxidoreductase [Microbacterium]SFI26015.1 cholesterol oxidase [Microbacterium saccharophilum]
MPHQLPDATDVLVVGSGFGASVAAYRLAEAGKDVVVLERGKAWGPGDFARTPAEMAGNFWDPSAGMYGLFDAWTFRGLEGLVSSGLGGGSLIYANVLLRKDPAWFVKDAPLPGGGYENWPVGYDDLEPHYEAVEQMMGATPYPYRDTAKTVAFERAAVDIGMPAFRPPLAVTFARPGEAPEPGAELPTPAYGNLHGHRRVTCTLCAECDVGCNTGAKNSLDHTYLSAARHHGAEIRTLHEVRGIRPAEGGGYIVSYVIHEPGASGDTSTKALPVRTIRAGRVILGAGSFGTTYLLLRSRAALRGLGPALGSRFSGNGDLLTFLMGCTRDGAPLRVDGGRGTVITSAIRMPDGQDGDGARGRGFYIEDAGFPAFLTWLVEVAQLRAMARRGARFGWESVRNRLFTEGRSNLSASIAQLLGDGHLSGSSLPLLGMGRDTPDGRMSLRRGRLAVDWTVATSRPYFARMREVMKRIGAELGADVSDNPLWWLGRVITVHPVGGAPMGRHPGEGVCDAYGEVFGHPGLHVLDGAALPGPVGANPSLTIAALADRACTRMLEQPWPERPRRAEPAVPAGVAGPPPAARADATSVSFTERMVGHVALGETDPRRGAERARYRNDDLEFVLTITAADIDAFTEDPLHEGAATGHVDGVALGGRCEVERGWFHLFVDPPARPGRRMLYRLWLHDAAGDPVTLVGVKDVADDDGFDLWRDTSTLYVHLLAGHVPPPPAQTPAERAAARAAAGDIPAGADVRAAGMLVIKPLDFAKQLTTFRTDGPAGIAALAAFGRLFLGELSRVYLTGDRDGAAR